MVEEVKIDKMSFDNQSDFEDLLRTYTRAHQNWRYYKERNLSMLTKSAEEAKVEAALQFAEYCMLHTCVIHLQHSDVIVLWVNSNNT